MKTNYLITLINFFYNRKANYKNLELSVGLYAIWKKFIKNKINVFLLVIACIFFVISCLGYLITPDKTQYANNQILEIALQKPGFKVQIIKIPRTINIEKQNLFYTMLWGQKNNYDFIPVSSYSIFDDTIKYQIFNGSPNNEGLSDKRHVLSVVLPLPKEAIITKNNDVYNILIDDYSFQINKNDVINKLKTCHIDTCKYILGTDRFGRDVFSMIIIGSRVSLSIGFVSVLLSVIIGLTLGSLAGYFGGFIDKIILWLINVVWSIPTLFLAIAITFALGKGFWQIFVAIGLTLWVDIARVIRGMVMSIKHKEFIEAAKAFGFSHLRIIFNHILPLTLGPLVVLSASNFATAILMESGLSFLGIGVQPPVPSWGSMLKENYGYLIMDYAYLALVPGIAISILVLTFMMIGNGLRDALDVHIQ